MFFKKPFEQPFDTLCCAKNSGRTGKITFCELKSLFVAYLTLHLNPLNNLTKAVFFRSPCNEPIEALAKIGSVRRSVNEDGCIEGSFERIKAD